MNHATAEQDDKKLYTSQVLIYRVEAYRGKLNSTNVRSSAYMALAKVQVKFAITETRHAYPE